MTSPDRKAIAAPAARRRGSFATLPAPVAPAPVAPAPVVVHTPAARQTAPARHRQAVPVAVRGVLLSGVLAGLLAAGSAGAQAPSASPGARGRTGAARTADQELDAGRLDAVREEQRQSLETQQRLVAEDGAIADERRALNRSLIDSAAKVRATEDRVATMQARLGELDGDEAAIRQSLDGRQVQITAVLAALQRIGRRPVPILTAAREAADQLRTAMALEAVLPQLRAEADRLQAELSDLVKVRTAKAGEHEQLTAELADLARLQKKMQELIGARQAKQAEVEQAIARERERALTLARQVDNLKDLIGKLEPGSDGAAARRPPRGAKTAALAALSDPARMTPAVAFVAAKGRLTLPVNGTKIHDFGDADGTGSSEKGISISARAGAQVTAPCDGWVVYAAPYRSYGQLLILNVGGGYHVLLAGMDRITVDPGQFVLTGEPVAVMGNGTRIASNSAPASSSVVGAPQPVLYIEFRKDGASIDSSPWWAATDEKVGG